jgi:SAM-dependent methyltransferase
MKSKVITKCLSSLGSHKLVSHYRAHRFCLGLCDVSHSLVLDAGCGPKPAVIAISNGYCVALDVSRENVIKARHNIKLLSIQNISCVIGDVEKLPFVAETFDVVSNRDVLEHLNDPRNGIKELVSSLKPNGKLLITTSNALNLTMLIDRLLPSSVSEKIIRKLGLSHYERHRRFNPWSLTRNMRRMRLEPKMCMCSVFPLNKHKTLRANSLELNKIICYIWILFDRISNISFLRYFKEVMFIFAEKS